MWKKTVSPPTLHDYASTVNATILNDTCSGHQEVFLRKLQKPAIMGHVRLPVEGQDLITPVHLCIIHCCILESSQLCISTLLARLGKANSDEPRNDLDKKPCSWRDLRLMPCSISLLL